LCVQLKLHYNKIKTLIPSTHQPTLLKMVNGKKEVAVVCRNQLEKNMGCHFGFLYFIMTYLFLTFNNIIDLTALTPLYKN